MTTRPITIDDFTMKSLDLAGRTKWEVVDKAAKPSEDFTPYLQDTLVVALEMELDTKGWLTPPSYKDIFGIDYYQRACPTCNTDGCYKCTPPKLFRKIHSDISINGPEAIIWGSPISSQEFANRLPLGDIKKYFQVTTKDSLHSHILISEYTHPNHKIIPKVVLKNAWSFFQTYYPSWVYLFGNQPGSFLRGSYGQWTRYNELVSYETWQSRSAEKFTGGIHFERCRYSLGGVTNLDVEIRTQDGTMHLDQIVALRALSKALLLKASSLASSEGLVEMPEPQRSKILETINVLNGAAYNHEVIEDSLAPSMKEQTYELYAQLKDYLSKFEVDCVKSCIESPVRHR